VACASTRKFHAVSYTEALRYAVIFRTHSDRPAGQAIDLIDEAARA
jgi:hypothetical protein